MGVQLIRALDSAYPYLGGLFVVSFLLFLLVSKGNFFKIGVYGGLLAIVAGVSFLSIFAIDGIVKAEARHEVLGYLDGLETADVSINGVKVDDPGKVLDMLRSMSGFWAHHSHPERRILIDIWSDHGRLVIRLGRDSGRTDEYWVYYPRYYVSNIDEIDRIRTHLLDNIQ
jgi:hypothetical protein